MEIQQRDNKTLAACVHHFKMEAKRCDFKSNTTTICIFVKDLWDAHNIIAKVYEKDSQTLLEVIKLVEKLNMAQHVTATLSSPTVNMMSNDDRWFVFGKTGHIGHCDGFGHFAQDFSEKIPHQEHLITMTDHAPNHIMIMPAGTDHSLSITHSQRKCFN